MATQSTLSYFRSIVGLIICLFALGSQISFAQKTRKLLPVRVVHIDPGTVSVMTFGPKHQMLTLRSKEENVRQFGGALRTITKNSVQFAGQKALPFADNERFYGQAGRDAFWTHQVIQTDSIPYTALRTYRIQNNKLAIQKEVRLPGYEFRVQSVGQTGNWVYSDCSEGDCGEVTLLDSELKPIKKYAPFSEGFQETGIFINDQRIGILIHPHGAEQPFKLAILDALTGAILQELDIPRQNHLASGFYVNRQYGLVVIQTEDLSRAETRCYNIATGQIIWTKSGNLLSSYSVTDNNQLLLHDYEDLTSYDLATGTIKWKTHIMDFHKTIRSDFNGVPIKVESDLNGRIYLLVKDFPTIDAPLSLQKQYREIQHTTLYELSSKGIILRRQRLGELGLEIRLSTTDQGILIKAKRPVTETEASNVQSTAQGRVAAATKGWPVTIYDNGSQGRITGTPGEFRQNSTKTNWRLHLGADIGPRKDKDGNITDSDVFAVNSGAIVSSSLVTGIGENGYYQIDAYGSYIKINDLYYYHVAPGTFTTNVQSVTLGSMDKMGTFIPLKGKNNIKKGELTKVTLLSVYSSGTVNIGEKIGEMYTVGIDSHVHMQKTDTDNMPIENYLNSGYFTTPSDWSYIDTSTPVVSSSGISFHQGTSIFTSFENGEPVQYEENSPLDPKGNHNYFSKNDEFSKQQLLVVPPPLNNTQTYSVLFGKADIISNAYNTSTDYKGKSEDNGHLAPYKLGYELVNLTTKTKVEGAPTITGKPTWPTIDFSIIKQKRGDIADRTKAVATKIHANGSQITAPKWIVTNRYQKGEEPIEDAWDTHKVPDGFYSVKVMAEGAPATPASLGGPNRGEATTTVYVDNNAPYIEEVLIGEGENQYSGRWTRDSNNPGQISFQLLSTSFKPKQSLSLKVKASEPMYNLSVSIKDLIVGAPATSDNMNFTFPITIPDNLQGPRTLEFDGVSAVGEKLVNLTKQDNNKNVNKRQLLVAFTEGKDVRHELTVCTSTTASSLSINVVAQNDQGSAVRLDASNGKPPYQYSKDNDQLSSVNTFGGLITTTTYTFKVADANGCTAVATYKPSGSPTSCNIPNTGGASASVQPFRHDLGTNAGTVVIKYDMYSVPDQLAVRYNGNIVATTLGVVSGAGSLSFAYAPTTNAGSFCVVEMTATTNGTEWQYTLSCPVTKANLRESATNEVVPNLSYQPGDSLASVQISLPANGATTNAPSQKRYIIRFRYLSDSLWTELRDQQLPFTIGSLAKGREVDVKIQEQEASTEPELSPLKVLPNPNNGEFVLQFDSKAPEPGTAQLEIVDAMGNRLLQRSWDVAPGVNRLPILLAGQTSGIIVIRLKLNEKIWVTTFLLNR